jgi:hypothetical protein
MRWGQFKSDSKSVARKGVWVQVPPPVLSFLGVFGPREIGCSRGQSAKPKLKPKLRVLETDWHRDGIRNGAGERRVH